MTSTNPSENAAPPTPYTAPRKEVWAWGAGRVAEAGLIMTFGQAMNIFTVGFGLNPVIVSWCMMLPRLVDGILDPIIGHWSDDFRSRWGRRKPFLVVGAILGALLLAALWWANPAWPEWAQFLYLGVGGTLLYLCYGTYAMAWTAVGYELSDDYHERSKIAAVGGFFLAIMAFAMGWMYWLALRPVFGGEIWGMRWIGAGMALLIVVTAFICAYFTKERFSHANRTHVPLGPAIRTTLKNRPFVILLIIKLFEILGGRVTGGIMFYVGVYYVCSGDKELATKIAGIGATVGTIWNFALLPLIKPISKWIGKKGALVAGSGVGLFSAVLTPFVLNPEHPYWMLIPTLIVSPLLVISGTISNAILPDICDLDELESGQRREGLFTSVTGFMAKMEISLSIILVGYIVSWAGVDTKIAVQTPDALRNLYWLVVIPGIVFAIAHFITTLCFPMSEKMMAEIRQALDARHRLRSIEDVPEEAGQEAEGAAAAAISAKGALAG